ncbi:Uncharacterised protein [Metamycoplasma alkalescens]|nr:Uncharacterised protein [Metamycoplasma alkalescens]
MLTLLFKMIDPFISLGLSINQKAKTEIIGYAATSGLFVVYLIIMFALTPLEKKVALSRKVKLENTLSETSIMDEEKIANIREAQELNELVLKSFETAR